MVRLLVCALLLLLVAPVRSQEADDDDPDEAVATPLDRSSESHVLKQIEMDAQREADRDSLDDPAAAEPTDASGATGEPGLRRRLDPDEDPGEVADEQETEAEDEADREKTVEQEMRDLDGDTGSEAPGPAQGVHRRAHAVQGSVAPTAPAPDVHVAVHATHTAGAPSQRPRPEEDEAR